MAHVSVELGKPGILECLALSFLRRGLNHQGNDDNIHTNERLHCNVVHRCHKAA